MNIDRFIERWQGAGVAKQLAILLAFAVRQAPNSELSIPMSEIDDILAGEQTIICRYDKGQIRLLFSPEYTTLYTIEAAVHERSSGSWVESRALGTSSDSAILTDERLADLEASQQRQRELREAAKQARVQPIYAGEKPQKKGDRKRPQTNLEEPA